MFVAVEREDHVERYKQGYRDQARGKENYLFNSILDENRAGSGVSGSCFFLFMSFTRMGVCFRGERRKKKTMQRENQNTRKGIGHWRK